MKKIAIIGAGVAGVTTALKLSNFDAKVSLFEKRDEIVSGPPFCHLHAGGNLYPDITDKERIQLLKESIEFLKFYPYAIDYRPTVIVFPKDYKKEPKEQIYKLKMLKKVYENLVKEDVSNKVLGDYYQVFEKHEFLSLKNEIPKDNPKSLQEWLIPVAKNIDINNIKFPVIIVNEYGINLFRLAAGATLSLQKAKNIELNLKSKVVDLKKNRDRFILTFAKNKNLYTESFDFVINAAGFKCGEIDDMLGFKKNRLVEFKAAYIAKWDKNIYRWPEIIFHGDRGTPKGMAQFTPYKGNYFQLHGMTKEITLFEDGVVKNSYFSSQPKLKDKYLNKIYKNWRDYDTRTKRAIRHFVPFLKKFPNEAYVGSKPLYGAQQIPGENLSLRATEISYEGKNYARCEIVKVSSAMSMSENIIKKLKDLNIIKIEKGVDLDIDNKKLENLSKKIAKKRGYPKELGEILNPLNLFA